MCEFKKIHKIGRSKKNDNIFYHQDYILEKCAIDSLSHWYVMHYVWNEKNLGCNNILEDCIYGRYKYKDISSTRKLNVNIISLFWTCPNCINLMNDGTPVESAQVPSCVYCSVSFSHKDSQHPALTGDLWGFFFWGFGWKWPSYITPLCKRYFKAGILCRPSFAARQWTRSEVFTSIFCCGL